MITIMRHCLSPSNQRFELDEVCPKDHVKLQGVSLCNVRRDICKPCPPVRPISAADCKFGKVVETKDINNCPVIE